jgi:hypothetical protein
MNHNFLPYIFLPWCIYCKPREELGAESADKKIWGKNIENGIHIVSSIFCRPVFEAGSAWTFDNNQLAKNVWQKNETLNSCFCRTFFAMVHLLQAARGARG